MRQHLAAGRRRGAADPDGVDATLIGTVVRPDGSKQLTVDGWPVYRYIKDMRPEPSTVRASTASGRRSGPTASPLRERPRPPRPPRRPSRPPAKAAPAKAPAAAPKVVRAAHEGPRRSAEGAAKPTAVAKPTVVRDAPGTSSTD